MYILPVGLLFYQEASHTRSVAVPRPSNKEANRKKNGKQCTTDYHYHKYPVLQTDVRDIHPLKKAGVHSTRSAVLLFCEILDRVLRATGTENNV